MGVRAGPEGAWIEIGFEKGLSDYYRRFLDKKIGEEIKKGEFDEGMDRMTRGIVNEIKSLVSHNIAMNVECFYIQTFNLNNGGDDSKRNPHGAGEAEGGGFSFLGTLGNMTKGMAQNEPKRYGMTQQTDPSNSKKNKQMVPGNQKMPSFWTNKEAYSQISNNQGSESILGNIFSGALNLPTNNNNNASDKLGPMMAKEPSPNPPSQGLPLFVNTDQITMSVNANQPLPKTSKIVLVETITTTTKPTDDLPSTSLPPPLLNNLISYHDNTNMTPLPNLLQPPKYEPSPKPDHLSSSTITKSINLMIKQDDNSFEGP